MDFDPLSLFTPQASNEQDEVLEVVDVVDMTDDILISDDDSHLQPLHILDLPLLQLKPNGEALLTILCMLAPNQVYNFSNDNSITDEAETIDVKQAFEDKGLQEATIEEGLKWLKINCPRFDSKVKVACIPNLSEALRKQYEGEYNGYLTRIISNDLLWIEDEDIKARIYKETALRISENCGRTAQPEIVRKIAIANLDKYFSSESGPYIKLKEPSLTSDNLGLKTWGSSLILANRLVNNDKDYILGEVLELGSGTGLVGIVSSILGHNTTLTDLPEITPNLKVNVDLNNILHSQVHDLDWTDPSSFVQKMGNITYHTILISDPIYSSKHPYWVVNMINQFLSRDKSARVLIQLPLRPKFENERETLWKLFDENGYIEEEKEIEDGYDDFGEMKFCFKKYTRGETTDSK
ncbi:uncharacterized protein CANTADRAFT_89375 [Suhomyces tanzawaensis NRRL Y-17324]|uniref:S-adenosyl-L-methionine-dependent methyltransferase n=1 Tax=Suhomyces tanzawaensis NRRL Y-17324 TaxID=984487 RepID=A0A1E4SJY1_9ASCO|nr:uncharacterized protein CANTADRAFT_89375 [Suhomyces tanzawaensis NRRL Y-17324]ODV79742.1 hypothetical protein CANTADRAFT_89375 [Suhomyces tanzawaensis NRRL Y-17324]